MNILLFIIIGVITGIFAGIFGVGGGIVLVPILVFLMGYEQFAANGTSLYPFSFQLVFWELSNITEPVKYHMNKFASVW
jgi:uncharacterized membrane protein YfcA